MSPERPNAELLADQRDRRRAEAELGTNFAVEAAAGAGKTTVLVTRLLELIRSGKATLDQIVAVTFTEKAAGELKVRVREEIERALDENLDPATEERFRGALDDLGHGPIGTIHSFCASLLRERPVEAGVDPQFAVADELTASLLRERVWGEWLEGELAAGNRAVLRAVSHGVNLEGQGHTVYGLTQKMLDCPDLLDGLPRRPDAGENAREFIHYARPKLATLVDQLDTYCSAEESAHFRGCMEDARRTLVLAEGLNDIQAEAEVMRLYLRRRFPGKQHWSRRESRDLARQIHAELKDRLEAVQEAIGADLAASAAEALVGFIDSYRSAKEQEGLLDFHDLLLLTRDMLVRSREARDHFKARYKHLLVDEFQDTDPLQVEIVFFLAERRGRHGAAWQEVELEPGKLFMVGDPKQSIYRFRRADIEVYEKAKAALSSQGDPLILSQSFRPVRQLAEAVNRIFAPVIKKPDDGLYQPDYVPLVPHRGDVAKRAAATVLFPPPEVRQELTNEDSARRAEAQCVAAMIRRIVGEGWEIVDPGTKRRRAVAYGDIAILARTFTTCERYADALASAGIPLRIIGGKHFYLAYEIHSLVAVLKAIDNPHDRLSLIAALRGPFFGVSDDELLVASCERGPLSYLDDDHGGDLGAALAVLRELHERRHAESLALFLQRLFEKTKVLELFYLRPRGAQRVANLVKIVERARELDGKQRVTFRGFVRWLSRLHETEADETESPMLEGEADFVQFLTIHRSKGLEFPVVFVADMTYGTGRASNFVVLRDRQPSEGQFAFYLGEEGLRVRTANWPGKEHEKVRAEAEAARLFYVAATRARDLLFLMAHWGKGRGGLAAFLGDELNAEDPSWGQRTACGTVFDTRTLDLKQGLGRPFRVRLPKLERLGKEAEKRLASREKWRQDMANTLAKAQEGIVWRTPSRLQDGFGTRAEVDAASPASGEGRRVGSLVHRCLERAGLDDASVLDALLEAEARGLRLSEEATSVARRLVRVAAESSLLRRALNAASCYHEVPFSAKVNEVVLTGLIDLLFVEDGQVVVVDFKTDAVRDEAELERRAESYRAQVLAYALAAHRILCKPVKEVILFFLSAEREWPIRVTEATLREASEHVVLGE